MYDLVIENAQIIDGSGAARFLGSVGVVGQTIAYVGAYSTRQAIELEAREVISGDGLVLCPGFIDVHSHDDFAALTRPELPWKALQGVTTVIVGNCGIGAAPFPGAEDWYTKLESGAALPDYSNYEGYLRRLDDVAPSLNIAVLAGHGSLRNAGAPGATRALSPIEHARVEAGLLEALEAGVFGMSAGLIYEPGIYADVEELTALAACLRPLAPLFTVHLRSEADDLLVAIEEALTICERAGVGLQLSHHKAHGRNNWGRVSKSLRVIEQARARGVDVWIDQYPYAAGSTLLKAVMDRGGLGGGPALGQLLPEDIVIANVATDESVVGFTLDEIAQRLGVSPTKAAEQLLAKDPGVWVVVHAMAETDVQMVMTHDATLFGSDGLPTLGGRPHPRLHGTFPRILGHYCRDLSILALEEAISKMTGRAAVRFALAGRGAIQVGAFADLVLFDAQTVGAGATYERPTELPVGIHGVWVNGQRVVRDGAHTGARPGGALRRQRPGR